MKMLSFPMFNIPYFFNSRKSCPQKSPVKHWTFFMFNYSVSIHHIRSSHMEDSSI